MENEKNKKSNPYLNLYKKEYAQAPCYYHLIDDGGVFICDECKKGFNGKDMIMTFTPDLSIQSVQCLDCTDDYWLNVLAKDLGKFPY